MSKVLCSIFGNLHSLPFLPLSPLWWNFQNKTSTEPLTASFTGALYTLILLWFNLSLVKSGNFPLSIHGQIHICIRNIIFGVKNIWISNFILHIHWELYSPPALLPCPSYLILSCAAPRSFRSVYWPLPAPPRPWPDAHYNLQVWNTSQPHTV